MRDYVLILAFFTNAGWFTPVTNAQDYEVVSVLSSQRFYLNGGNRAMMGGKSRAVLAVPLPDNTVEWYYTLAAYHSPQAADRAQQSYSLFTTLVNTLDQTGLASLSTRIMQPTGAEVCDVFLLPDTETSHFINKDDNSLIGNGAGFRRYETASRANFTSGVVPVKQAGLQRGTYYLGVRNPSATTGIHVNIEVHAIVRKATLSQPSVAVASQPAMVSVTNRSTAPVSYQYSRDGVTWKSHTTNSGYQASLRAEETDGTLLIRLNSLCTGTITYRLDTSSAYEISFSKGCWEIVKL